MERTVGSRCAAHRYVGRDTGDAVRIGKKQIRLGPMRVGIPTVPANVACRKVEPSILNLADTLQRQAQQPERLSASAQGRSTSH